MFSIIYDVKDDITIVINSYQLLSIVIIISLQLLIKPKKKMVGWNHQILSTMEIIIFQTDKL